MGQDSKIEWTHHTANLWHGCTKVHQGCDHCYAETLSKRWGKDVWGNDKPRMEIKSVWNDFKKYQKLAAEAGEVHRVFVGSMMDIFEKRMPLINSQGEKLFNVKINLSFSVIGYSTFDLGDGEKSTSLLRDYFFRYIIPSCPNLLFLLLTKRPSNINKFTPDEWKNNPPSNVMFGTSPVNQETSEKLISQLLQVKGKKFLSVEPQLEEIKLKSEWLTGSPMQQGKIDWIIQGGESGHGKRPFDIGWGISMRDQCAKHEVPYFFKQIDKIQPIPEALLVRQFPVFEK